DTGARVDRRDRRDLGTLGGAQVPTRVLIARSAASDEWSGRPAFGLLARAEGLLLVRRIGAVHPEMVPDGANPRHRGDPDEQGVDGLLCVELAAELGDSPGDVERDAILRHIGGPE